MSMLVCTFDKGGGDGGSGGLKPKNCFLIKQNGGFTFKVGFFLFIYDFFSGLPKPLKI